MITQLSISNFRGFSEFQVHDLGRINLLVGTNNCGKTSILEAVQILASHGDASTIWQIASRRGEHLYDQGESRTVYSPEVDIRHLYYGHELRVGSQFTIEAQSDTGPDTFSATVVARDTQPDLFEQESITGTGELEEDAELLMELRWSDHPEAVQRLPLSFRGGIPTNIIRRLSRIRQDVPERVQFISTAGLSIDDVVSMFEDVVLTKEEQLVTDALRTIDPSIERIATLSGDRRRTRPGERGGIVVKCKSSSQRYPIGSMGDGMWRLLGLSLAIASAQNGVLLIDEIDTGLHYSVMEDVWRLIDKASKRLNVQVFATSHSRDAYESLASISRSSISKGSQVTIQRINRDDTKSVAFTEQEIIATAERGTEVR